MFHAVYYVPSRAPFLCSDRNCHTFQLTVYLRSSLFCRTVIKRTCFYQDTGRDRVTAALCSFHLCPPLPFYHMDLKGNILLSSYDITGFIWPLFHEADMSHFQQMLSNSSSSSKDFSLISSFKQKPNFASLRLKRGVINSLPNSLKINTMVILLSFQKGRVLWSTHNPNWRRGNSSFWFSFSAIATSLYTGCVTHWIALEERSWACLA